MLKRIVDKMKIYIKQKNKKEIHQVCSECIYKKNCRTSIDKISKCKLYVNKEDLVNFKKNSNKIKNKEGDTL